MILAQETGRLAQCWTRAIFRMKAWRRRCSRAFSADRSRDRLAGAQPAGRRIGSRPPATSTLIVCPTARGSAGQPGHLAARSTHCMRSPLRSASLAFFVWAGRPGGKDAGKRPYAMAIGHRNPRKPASVILSTLGPQQGMVTSSIQAGGFATAMPHLRPPQGQTGVLARFESRDIARSRRRHFPAGRRFHERRCMKRRRARPLPTYR